MLWFFADKFCSQSYTQHFKFRETATSEGKTAQMHCIEHYELIDYATTRYSSSVPNIMARLRLLLMKAIKDHVIFPKAIIFVLDNDVIKQSRIPVSEAAQGDYILIVKYLLEEISRVISAYVEKLPMKAKDIF